MVGTPIGRRVTRHRRAASFRALCAISLVSPVRPEERRAERNRLMRDRTRRADAAFYRGLLDYCGVPRPPPRRRRQPLPQPPAIELPIIISSDESADDLPEPPQQPPVVVVDLKSSLDELPDLDITQEFPPLEHQVFREAYVLLERLQDQSQRPLTPPPETEVDWAGLEEALADFDAPQHPLVLPLQQQLVPPPLILQQPDVDPYQEFVPQPVLQPPPLPQVDWAMVAYALFSIAERKHRDRLNHPN